jgi:Ca-activated chloride channel family protein
MVWQIAARSTVGSGQWAVRVRAANCLLALSAVILAASSGLAAESVASKNKEGNRLFAQGKYEDAEKAYLDAQVNSPGKPEVLYNLGNSLIKQGKYDQGIRALRQSISKGDTEIREDSWYNTGNALFSMGDFKNSADAFIQALRLAPGDKDAKHNLELALMKLKQQEQKQSNANQKQNSKNQNQDQSRAGTDDRKQPTGRDQNGSGEAKEPPNQHIKPETPKNTQREGSIGKEQALHILDAVQSQELEEQRKLLEHRARDRTNAKDW